MGKSANDQIYVLDLALNSASPRFQVDFSAKGLSKQWWGTILDASSAVNSRIHALIQYQETLRIIKPFFTKDLKMHWYLEVIVDGSKILIMKTLNLEDHW